MAFKAKLRRFAGFGTAVAFAVALPAAAGHATVAAAADNIFYVKNGNTGRCLTADNLQQPYRNEVSTRDCVGAATQKWRIVGGHFTPQGSATPARCLDVVGDSAFTWHCDGSTGQDWRTNGESTTWISSVKYSGQCLHSTGAYNAPVSINPCGSQSSRWVITPAP